MVSSTVVSGLLKCGPWSPQSWRVAPTWCLAVTTTDRASLVAEIPALFVAIDDSLLCESDESVFHDGRWGIHGLG